MDIKDYFMTLSNDDKIKFIVGNEVISRSVNAENLDKSFSDIFLQVISDYTNLLQILDYDKVQAMVARAMDMKKDFFVYSEDI